MGSNPTVTAIVMSPDIFPDLTHKITIFLASFRSPEVLFGFSQVVAELLFGCRIDDGDESFCGQRCDCFSSVCFADSNVT